MVTNKGTLVTSIFEALSDTMVTSRHNASF